MQYASSKATCIGSVLVVSISLLSFHSLIASSLAFYHFVPRHTHTHMLSHSLFMGEKTGLLGFPSAPFIY